MYKYIAMHREIATQTESMFTAFQALEYAETVLRGLEEFSTNDEAAIALKSSALAILQGGLIAYLKKPSHPNPPRIRQDSDSDDSTSSGKSNIRSTSSLASSGFSQADIAHFSSTRWTFRNARSIDPRHAVWEKADQDLKLANDFRRWVTGKEESWPVKTGQGVKWKTSLD